MQFWTGWKAIRYKIRLRKSELLFEFNLIGEDKSDEHSDLDESTLQNRLREGENRLSETYIIRLNGKYYNTKQKKIMATGGRNHHPPEQVSL